MNFGRIWWRNDILGQVFWQCWAIFGVREHRRETLIWHIDVIGHLCSENQRTPEESDGRVAFLGGSRGNAGPILRAQEHRKRTLICDARFIKFYVLKNQRTPEESGDPMALLETS